MARIFISHSSRDNDAANDIKRWLEGQGFEQTFLDIDKHSGIPPGANWERELYEKIASSQAMLLIATSNWQASKWCFVEFAQARALGKPIFPIIIAPDGERLIAPDIQQLDLRLDRDGGLDRLARELWTLAVNLQGGFAWDASRPPFPGLAAFEREDAAIFFGRDDDVRACIEQLNARRVYGALRAVVLLGASGSGKSSVLRAGVLPRIALDRTNWLVIPPFRPGRDPFAALARAVAEALDEPNAWQSWRDRLSASDPDPALQQLVDTLRTHLASREAQVLVSVDQGEELFTLAPPEAMAAFIALLLRIANGPAPLILLFCMRSDYLDRLQQAVGEVRFTALSLGPFQLQRVREIIEGPANVAGIRVANDLVATVLADMKVADALPLLAFTLRELYDQEVSASRQPNAGPITLTATRYHLLGNAADELTPLENAVQLRATKVLDALACTPDDLRALREAFVGHMVRLDDEGLYNRCPADWDALPPRAHPILQALEAVRLVVMRQGERGRVVEAVHEALLRNWKLLRGWLDEEKDFLIGRRQVRTALLEWQRASPAEKDQALLRGLLLRRAVAWLRAHAYGLSLEERDFITASLRLSEAEARQSRNRRLVAWLLAGVAAACVAVAGFFLHEQNLARNRAEAAALVVRARERLANGDARDAATDALHAVAQDDGVEARSVLLEALLAVPPFLDRGLQVDGLQPDVLAWSSAADLAIGGAGRIVIWRTGATAAAASPTDIDFDRGQRVQSMRAAVRALQWEGATLTAVTADGRVLSGTAGEGTMRSRTLGTPDQVKHASLRRGLVVASMFEAAELREFHCPPNGIAACASSVIDSGYATALALAPNGRTVASGGDDGTLRLIGADGQNAAPVEPRSDNAPIRALAWSADSSRLAVGTADGQLDVVDPAGRPLATARDSAASVSSVAWDPQGARLAAACGTDTICVWAFETGRATGPALSRIARLSAGGAVTALAWSPDGSVLASSAGDIVQLWSIDRRDDAIFTLDTGGTAALSELRLAPAGDWLAAGDDQGQVHLWRYPSFAAAIPIQDESVTTVRALAWSHSGRLAAADPEGHVVATRPLQPDAAVRMSLPTDDVRALGWLPDEDGIVSAGSLDGTLATTPLPGEPTPRPFGQHHRDAVTALALSPDATRLVSADAVGTAQLWVLASRVPGAAVATGAGRGTAAFSDDGAFFLVAGNDADVVVYDASDPSRTPRHCRSGSTMLDDAAFARNGRAVYAMSGDRTPRLYVWSLGNTCDLLATAPVPQRTGTQFPPEAAGKEQRHLAVLPSGRVAITASSPEVWIISPDPAAWIAEARTLDQARMALKAAAGQN
jgi:WD40 repeat protein